MSSFLVLASLIIMVLVNVPIGVSIGAVALAGMLVASNFDINAATTSAALAMFDGTAKFNLLAIPLYVLAGALMNTGGISRRLINFVSSIVGFIRGGLAMVTVGTSMIFAEISGSSVADVAALGSILIPEMKKRGYRLAFAAAVNSSAASLAVIIPPSMPMIIYGAIANVSITKLFVAGIPAGLIGGAGMFALCYYYARKYNFPCEDAFSLKRLWSSFKEACWALTLPIIILGGILSGLTNATEAATLAVVAALFIGTFIYREMTFALLGKALVEGVSNTAVVMLLVGTSAVLGQYLVQQEMPQHMARFILDISDNKHLVLLMLNIMLFIVGMFLHGTAAIILVVPVVMPLAQQLGIDPIHFGLILTLNIAIGQQTPPVASVLAVACTIAKEDIWKVTKANFGFIGVLVAVLLIVTYFPVLSVGFANYINPAN